MEDLLAFLGLSTRGTWNEHHLKRLYYTEAIVSDFVPTVNHLLRFLYNLHKLAQRRIVSIFIIL